MGCRKRWQAHNSEVTATVATYVAIGSEVWKVRNPGEIATLSHDHGTDFANPSSRKVVATVTFLLTRKNLLLRRISDLPGTLLSQRTIRVGP